MIQLHHIFKKGNKKKWVRKGELSKEWAFFIVNPNAQPEINSMLYKTHKRIYVRLLTTGCNTVEKHCAKLTKNYQ